MFKQTLKGLFFAIVAILIATPVQAAGSAGYRVELPDAGAQAMGSAFVGEADTPAAVYYNPAGLTQIEGNQMSLGYTLLLPSATRTDSSGNETKMQDSEFHIPNFYYVADLNSERFALGIGLLSSWGTGTEWADDSFAKYVNTKTELTSKDFLLTGAMKVTDKWSVAASLDLNQSDVNKHKKLNQVTSDGHFRLHGDSDAVGYRLATYYKANEKHSFGFIYRSKMEHKFKGKVELSDLNTTAVLTGIGSYQTAFGGASYSTDFESKSTYPQSMVLGYSYKPTQKWTINADVEWMDWSSTENELLTYPNETDPVKLGVLNTGNPAHRDWDSAYSLAVGTEYQMKEWLRLRTGYFFHDKVIPEANYESSIVDGQDHGFTTGFGLDLSKSLTLDTTYSYLFTASRDIDNSVGLASGASVDGEYEKNLHYLMVALNYKF